MKIMSGYSVMDTVVEGKLYYIETEEPVMSRVTAKSSQEEWARFVEAQNQAILELATLYDLAREELGEDYAAIFAIHAMMLEDEEVLVKIEEHIQRERVTAEWAVRCAGRELEQVFRGMQDSYMQARSYDIRDLTQRMVSLLTQSAPRYVKMSDEPVILLTRWINPSEVMLLDKQQVLGVVVEQETTTSHTAILARQRGIPLLSGVPVSPGLDGYMAVLDGRRQCLRVMEPPLC